MDKITKILSGAIKNLYGQEAELLWAAVPEGIEGDYATNVALRLAKTVGKAPRAVAEEIIGQVGELSGVKFSIAGPGFINVEQAGTLLAEELETAWTENYGENSDGAGKTALVEFPSTNIAKPYSVGHLRPGTQGWMVKRLLETTGWKVVTDNHLGDAGTPFGIWAVGFLRSGKSLETVTVYDLGEIYIEMKRLLKEESERGERALADEVQAWLLKLEAGEAEALRLSERFKEISLKHTHEVMERLGIATDVELGESFFVEQGKAAVEKYLKEGVFERNKDDSVICKLDEYGIEVPMLLLKSNGAALYATNDLGCMIYRAERWQPDLVVYAVGQEQKFYFEQLFAVGKKIGLPQKNVHLYFGMIDQLSEEGKREKMSSRKGVVLMEEMLDDAERRVRENFGKDLADGDIKKIAVGAIKFSDFVADRKTGILYDPERIFSLSGFSGPFCQYATVRVRRILAKNKEWLAENGGFEGGRETEYDWGAEKKLLLKLLEFPALVRAAAEALDGHKVAEFCFELAQELNRYYEQAPVTAAEPEVRRARLGLLGRADVVLTKALDILGVAIPEKM